MKIIKNFIKKHFQKPFKKSLYLITGLVIILAISLTAFFMARAEQSGARRNLTPLLILKPFMIFLFRQNTVRMRLVHGATGGRIRIESNQRQT